MARVAHSVPVTRSMRKRAAANPSVALPNDAKNSGDRSATSVKPRRIENTAEDQSDANAKSGDPQMCPAYASEIYSYLRQMEIPRPVPDKVRGDGSMMRAVMVDWLVDVAHQHKLLSNTLYLSVSYMDRYLWLNAVSPQKMTVLGVSCVLVAAKYEEIDPPHIIDLSRCIVDNTYEMDEILEMEATLLKALDFRLGHPTANTFLPWFTRIAQEKFNKANFKLEFLCCYLADLSLSDYRCCVKFLPSLVAASVVFLAACTMWPESHPWNVKLQDYSGYTPAQLKECVLIIHGLHKLSRREGMFESIKDKYEKRKFKAVAKLSSLPEVPASYFEYVET